MISKSTKKYYTEKLIKKFISLNNYSTFLQEICFENKTINIIQEINTLTKKNFTRKNIDKFEKEIEKYISLIDQIENEENGKIQIQVLKNKLQLILKNIEIMR